MIAHWGGLGQIEQVNPWDLPLGGYHHPTLSLYDINPLLSETSEFSLKDWIIENKNLVYLAVGIIAFLAILESRGR